MNKIIMKFYFFEGNQLLLSFKITGEMLRWKTDFNEGERSPFGGGRTFNCDRPSRIQSYTFIFNEENTIQYLNESPFEKQSLCLD